MLRKLIKFSNHRNFSKTGIWRNLEKTKPAVPEETGNPEVKLRMDYIPSSFDRQLLLWFGKYKSKEDIPTRVSVDFMESVKSRFRIVMATILMGGVLGMCFFYVQLGKKKVREGETMTTVQKRRQEMISERLK